MFYGEENKVLEVVDGIGKIFERGNYNSFFGAYGEIRHTDCRIGYIRNNTALAKVPFMTICCVTENREFTIHPNSKTTASEHVKVNPGDFIYVTRENGLANSKLKVYIFFSKI